MADITITKVDETYVKIDANAGILMEISDWMTFLVPGHRFMPAFKHKMWDGKIRLLNTLNKQLYLGLIPHLKEFANNQGYSVECDIPDTMTDFSLEECREMVRALKIHARGQPIEVRDYQYNAIIHAIRNRRSLLLSPTSSGKSLIIYCLVRYYLAKTSGKVLIIVPTTQLVEQMYSDFADYSSAIKWDVKDHCHRIYSGREKVSQNCRVIISTWQSIYKMPKQYFSQFSTVIGDECHLFTAKSLSNILEKMAQTPYRFGTTGTIQESKTHVMVLEGLYGKVFKVTTTKELMDKGTVANLVIKCLVLKYPEESCKEMARQPYADEIEWLETNQARIKFVRNLAKSLDGNTLVLFQHVERHGNQLYDSIQSDPEISGRKTFYVHGKTEVEDREAVRAIVEKETNAIIVASYGTFSTGINIQNIDNVIFASPTKSKIRVLQSIGRGLRVSERKNSVTLFDISDNLSYKSYRNYGMKHFSERVKYYVDEKFVYKIYKEIELKDRSLEDAGN